MKKVLGILVAIILISLEFNTVSVLAFGGGLNTNYISSSGGGNNVDVLKNPINRATKTILTVLQIVSVAGVLILGVKYMFTSASGRAEYKKGLVMVVIGLVLVFCATTVASFVVDSFEDAIPTSNSGIIQQECY